MTLKDITIKIKNLDEEGLERVKSFVVVELEQAGLKVDVEETDSK